MRTWTRCILVVTVVALVVIPGMLLCMTRERASVANGAAGGEPTGGALADGTPIRLMRDYVDGAGGSRFIAAVQIGHYREARRLIRDGADPNMPDPSGWGAVHFATLGGDWEMLSLLLEHGADPRARTGRSLTALHVAATHAASGGEACDGRGIRVLVAAGLDVDIRGRRDATPLHIAAENGRTEHVLVLAELGADVNARDDAGRTPLSYADEQDRTETAEVLRGLGAGQ